MKRSDIWSNENRLALAQSLTDFSDIRTDVPLLMSSRVLSTKAKCHYFRLSIQDVDGARIDDVDRTARIVVYCFFFCLNLGTCMVICYSTRI